MAGRGIIYFHERRYLSININSRDRQPIQCSELSFREGCLHEVAIRNRTTVRWNVYLNRFDEPTAQKDALAHVEKTHLQKRNRYGLRGVDFFAWNREMYHEHIVPNMPSFTLPLFVADHYLLHDASCNALVLMTEQSVPSAKLYHLTTSRERD